VNLNTARRRHNLGWILWKQARDAEAEPLLRTASIDIPKTYGPTHRGWRLALSNLALTLNVSGALMPLSPRRSRRSRRTARCRPIEWW
jgi:hypothetical protein